ncbi:recombinase family protein [Bradyrhizobium arachidis]|uniref:recombinase family protein n=1 Tax=Bradyrhizobium arachidis TaxID=858423 RepID=UPI003D31C0BD
MELYRTFTDQASGKDTDRPALTELVAYVRQRDTVVVPPWTACHETLKTFAVPLGCAPRGASVFTLSRTASRSPPRRRPYRSFS